MWKTIRCWCWLNSRNRLYGTQRHGDTKFLLSCLRTHSSFIVLSCATKLLTLHFSLLKCHFSELNLHFSELTLHFRSVEWLPWVEVDDADRTDGCTQWMNTPNCLHAFTVVQTDVNQWNIVKHTSFTQLSQSFHRL